MRTLVLCAFVLTVYASPGLAATPSPACEAKRANIESQISEATARGRTQEVAGLRKALRANKAHCTDKSLASEREKRIQQAQRKVDEREKSLREAQHKGDAKKIATRKAKLEEARRDLVEAEKPLPQ
jgi:hypothetical protein